MEQSQWRSLVLWLLLFACTSGMAQTLSPLARDAGSHRDQTCLPVGVCLDPAGQSFEVGNMPLAIVPSPEADRLVLSLMVGASREYRSLMRRPEQSCKRFPSLERSSGSLSPKTDVFSTCQAVMKTRSIVMPGA